MDRSALELTLRALVSRYVAGVLSYSAFSLDFHDESWGITREEDEGAAQVTFATELLLAEFTSGHRSELSLREALRDGLLG